MTTQRLWVVEYRRNGQWKPIYITFCSRDRARLNAKRHRSPIQPTRIRKYIPAPTAEEK